MAEVVLVDVVRDVVDVEGLHHIRPRAGRHKRVPLRAKAVRRQTLAAARLDGMRRIGVESRVLGTTMPPMPL